MANRCDHWSLINHWSDLVPIKLEPWLPWSLSKHLRTPIMCSFYKKIFILSVILLKYVTFQVLQIENTSLLEINLSFFVHCSPVASMFEISRINQPGNTILNLWACINQVSIHWDGMEPSLGVRERIEYEFAFNFPIPNTMPCTTAKIIRIKCIHHSSLNNPARARGPEGPARWER